MKGSYPSDSTCPDCHLPPCLPFRVSLASALCLQLHLYFNKASSFEGKKEHRRYLNRYSWTGHPNRYDLDACSTYGRMFKSRKSKMASWGQSRGSEKSSWQLLSPLDCPQEAICQNIALPWLESWISFHIQHVLMFDVATVGSSYLYLYIATTSTLIQYIRNTRLM